MNKSWRAFEQGETAIPGRCLFGAGWFPTVLITRCEKVVNTRCKLRTNCDNVVNKSWTTLEEILINMWMSHEKKMSNSWTSWKSNKSWKGVQCTNEIV